MIDFHVGCARLANPFQQVLNNHKGPFEAYGMEFIQYSPGRYLPTSKTLYKNTFRLKLIYPDIIIVQNSLHKYFQGGFNVFDFSYLEMLSSIKELYSGLRVANVGEVILSKPEFECPLIVENPETFYKSLISYKNIPFLDLSYKGKLFGKYLETDTYKLKAYSKYQQMKTEPKSYKEFVNIYPDQVNYLKRVLRLELQIKKSRFLKLGQALKIEDLSDQRIIRTIYDQLATKFSRSLYSPNLEALNALNESDLSRYAIMTHTNQLFAIRLREINKSRYDYYKRKVISSNTPSFIGEKIKQKASTLLL